MCGRAGKCYPGKVCTVTAPLPEKVAPCSQEPRGPECLPHSTATSDLMLEDISGCSFSLGVFIIKSQTEDKKTWLLKWCNFRVSGFWRIIVIEECRIV